MRQDVLRFIPVSNLTDVRSQHPQGVLAPQGDTTILARRLHQRMQIHKMSTEQGFSQVAQGKATLNESAMLKAHGLMDALGVIQAADRHLDTAYYEQNKALLPEGYEPIESFGTRNFIPVTYENTEAYKAARKDGSYTEDLQQSTRELYNEAPPEKFSKGVLKECHKVANIGTPGLINHPDTGLQAGAFINHERKSAVIGFAGLNFEPNEFRDAILNGGKRQFEAAQQEVKDLLLSGEIPEDYEVTICGHSMGAAISQRMIYAIKEDPELRHVDARAVNFDAPQVCNLIEDYEPSRVKRHECININFTKTIGSLDFSKLPGRFYGGGHVGGGFYQMESNFADKAELADFNTKGSELFSTTGRVARGLVNHQMINGVETMVSKHLMTGKEVPFVETGTPKVKEVKEREPQYGLEPSFA